MPDVSPAGLVAARRGYKRVYGTDPDAREGICGLCGKRIDQEKQNFVIAVNGVWAHYDCIGTHNHDEGARNA